MNGNEFYYKKLKKNESVQNILHESDSIIYCSNCSRKIMSENYCSKCGKNSIVIKKVDPNYLTSFVKGSQKYAKTAKTKTDFLVYWTQSKLEKFNYDMRIWREFLNSMDKISGIQNKYADMNSKNVNTLMKVATGMSGR